MKDKWNDRQNTRKTEHTEEIHKVGKERILKDRQKERKTNERKKASTKT